MTYTYLKKSVPDFFLEMEEELDDKLFDIGTTWEDFLNDKFLLLSDKQVAYKKANPKANAYDVWIMVQPEPPKERTLEDAKKEMIAKINRYDKSNSVSGFYINGNIMWLNMNQRANALLTLESAKALGIESVPYLGVTFPTEAGIHAIHVINLYVAQALAITEQHKATVNAMTSVTDVDTFDYTEGYPEQPSFTF